MLPLPLPLPTKQASKLVKVHLKRGLDFALANRRLGGDASRWFREILSSLTVFHPCSPVQSGAVAGCPGFVRARRPASNLTATVSKKIAAGRGEEGWLPCRLRHVGDFSGATSDPKPDGGLPRSGDMGFYGPGFLSRLASMAPYPERYTALAGSHSLTKTKHAHSGDVLNPPVRNLLLLAVV